MTRRKPRHARTKGSLKITRADGSEEIVPNDVATQRARKSSRFNELEGRRSDPKGEHHDREHRLWKDGPQQ